MWFSNLLFLSLGCFLLGGIGCGLLPRRESEYMIFLGGTLGGASLFLFSGYVLLSSHLFTLYGGKFFGQVRFVLSVDPLSAIFLLITSIVIVCSCIFASSYISLDREGRGFQGMSAIYFFLLISVIGIFVAGDIFSFIMAWESTAICIYLLVCLEGGVSSAYIMLGIGEAGTVAIVVGFILLASLTGTMEFSHIAQNSHLLSSSTRWWVFILCFLGFGIKAGLLPLNFWLPRAYRRAPAPFIPFIAGATLNLGLYGIIRVCGILLPGGGSGEGMVMLLTGAITAIIGILYATIGDDFREVLAHSSIENAGIITIGLGAGFVFLSLGHTTFAAMAFTAAIYHILNHSIFKTLLFMGQTKVEQGSGIRSLDLMGGILKKMPITGFLVLIGVMAISAMPPFNGFISEWLTLESLLRSVELSSTGIKFVFIFAGVLLALTAGLALTCFVRLFAMGFLGVARSKRVGVLREKGRGTIVAMGLLALLCFSLGITPTYVIPMLDRVVSPLCGTGSTFSLIPPFFHNTADSSHLPPKFLKDFYEIGARAGSSFLPGRGLVILHRGTSSNPVVFAASPAYMFIAIAVIVFLSMVGIWFFSSRKQKTHLVDVWDGGIKTLFPEMTYTASGFAQPIRVVFDAIFRPTVLEDRRNVSGLFQAKIKKEIIHTHLVDKFILYPIIYIPRWCSRKLARMHNGELSAYTAYVFVVLLAGMLIIAYLSS